MSELILNPDEISYLLEEVLKGNNKCYNTITKYSDGSSRLQFMDPEIYKDCCNHIHFRRLMTKRIVKYQKQLEKQQELTKERDRRCQEQQYIKNIILDYENINMIQIETLKILLSVV